MGSVISAPTYRFSVEQYYKMGEAGIFYKDSPVELLDGHIVVQAAASLRHGNAVRRLINFVAPRFADRCLFDAKNLLMIDSYSMPQPDFMLLRHTADSRDSAPIPEDVLLLIEVADTSLTYDSRDKREAYARTGIAEYWILDLTRNELHVYREPSPNGYGSETVIRGGESIAPLAFPEDPVAVAEILPP